MSPTGDGGWRLRYLGPWTYRRQPLLPTAAALLPGKDHHVMSTQDITGDAIERLAELTATSDYDIDTLTPDLAWIDGYIEGHRAARDELGAAHPDANSDPR